MKMIKVLRLADILFSLLGLVLLWPVLLVIYVICLFETGAPIFRQRRVGLYQEPFTLLKFRSMHPDTVCVASHLVDKSAVTRFGVFLRQTKLDELLQLFNVLKGEMSLVGPRPCLFDQNDLIEERVSRGIFNVRPGITGRAQLNNVDMSTPKLLAEQDALLLQELTVFTYFKYIFMTLAGKGRGIRPR